MCCRVLPCVAMCCHVLSCVAMCYVLLIFLHEVMKFWMDSSKLETRLVGWTSWECDVWGVWCVGECGVWGSVVCGSVKCGVSGVYLALPTL